MKQFSEHKFHSLISILGISMGDEGKGRVVHEILEQIHKEDPKSLGAVMKVNGGANAGHTAAGLKLNLLPSGVGSSAVESLIVGSGVVADPRKFLWEAIPLEYRGLSVLERLKIDEKCQLSDISHRLLDLAWENYRVKQLGQKSRGSTGRGISPAYCDETGQWQIFYQIFLDDRSEFKKAFKQRIDRAMDIIQHVCKITHDDWYEFFEILTAAEKQANQDSVRQNLFPSEEFEFKPFATDEPFSLNFEYAEEVYWQAGTKLRDNIVDIRPLVLRKFSEKKSVVVEFGQAFWLDKRHGFTPNVTASHTFSSEVFQSACIPLREMSQIGCCKAYDTKVGTHHFITKIDPSKSKLAHKLAKLEFGTSTGRQRMVGWFDAVEKGNALRFGGFEYLVINKLDALSSTNEEFNEIKICTGYENPEGQEVSTVPRCEKKHKELKPIYEKLPAWTEDISDCKKFEELPSNAQNYVSRMFQAVCFNAYGENWFKHKLPKLLFIGVGPDPKQIIQDIPSFLPKEKNP